LTDEELGELVTKYGDALYTRYMQKFGGFLGGSQKGINFAMDKVNPLSQIIDEDGNLSLSGVVKLFLSGKLGSMVPNASQSSGQSSQMDSDSARRRSGLL